MLGARKGWSSRPALTPACEGKRVNVVVGLGGRVRGRHTRLERRRPVRRKAREVTRALVNVDFGPAMVLGSGMVASGLALYQVGLLALFPPRTSYPVPPYPSLSIPLFSGIFYETRRGSTLTLSLLFPFLLSLLTFELSFTPCAGPGRPTRGQQGLRHHVCIDSPVVWRHPHLPGLEAGPLASLRADSDRGCCGNLRCRSS